MVHFGGKRLKVTLKESLGSGFSILDCGNKAFWIRYVSKPVWTHRGYVLRVNSLLRCVWKQFPRGTSLCGTPLMTIPEHSECHEKHFKAYLGKGNHTSPCSSEELCFDERKGATEEWFGGRYGFPSFKRAFVSTTGLESFFEVSKVVQMISFGGGSVHLLLCLEVQRFWNQKCNLRIPW